MGKPPAQGHTESSGGTRAKAGSHCAMMPPSGALEVNAEFRAGPELGAHTWPHNDL